MKPIIKRIKALERTTGPAYGVIVTASPETSDEAITKVLATAGLNPGLMIRVNRFQTETAGKPEIVGRFSL